MSGAKARPADDRPPKPHATLDSWIWVLIYGGLFLLILGIATGRT